MEKNANAIGQHPLQELSNAMVVLHREHYGRGPAAVKSLVVDGFAVCVMSDVFTRIERRLIDAGRGEHVQLTRMLHQQTCEEDYTEAAAAALGRPVVALLSAVRFNPDLEVKIFVLGPHRPNGG